MLYFLIAFGAAFLGSIVGMGGGILIKPLLDATSAYDTAGVSVISSLCAFSMAVMSAGKHLQRKVPLRTGQTLALGLGAAPGGIAGRLLLTRAILCFGDPAMRLLQNALLILLVAFVALYMARWKQRPVYELKSTAAVLLCGALLGAVSTFLGIGGGPFNVAVLCLFFAMDVKAAAISSVFIIALSQASMLCLVLAQTGRLIEDAGILLYMIPGALLGGLAGSIRVHALEGAVVSRIYQGVLLFILLVSLYNIAGAIPGLLPRPA